MTCRAHESRSLLDSEEIAVRGEGRNHAKFSDAGADVHHRSNIEVIEPIGDARRHFDRCPELGRHDAQRFGQEAIEGPISPIPERLRRVSDARSKRFHLQPLAGCQVVEAATSVEYREQLRIQGCLSVQRFVHALHQGAMFRKDATRKLSPETPEELKCTPRLLEPGRAVYREEPREPFPWEVQSGQIERFLTGEEADRRFDGLGATLHAIEDPLQHADVVAEPRPEEAAIFVGAEPVDVKDLRRS